MLIPFLARFLSLLFHPVNFLVPMPFFLVYKQTADSRYALKWEIYSFLFIILGIALFIWGRKKGFFSDQDLSKREERYLFYRLIFFLTLFYLVSAVFFKGILFPISIAAFGIVLGLLLFEIVNRYLKVSIHVGVASAFVIAMTLLYGPKILILTVWIIPLTLWSRLALKKHTAQETLVGGLLGVFITIITFLLGRQLILLQSL